MDKFLNAQISPAFVNGVQQYWSASTIKMAETCLRKYQYEMLEGWHERGKNVHLRFGGHYATALEHFHKWLAEGMSYDEAMRATVREAMIETWDHEKEEASVDEGTLGFAATRSALRRIPGTGAPWDSDHNTKTRATLIRTIVWYLEQFREDPAMPVKLADGSPAVELSFQLPVDNGIILVGHLDRLSEYADNLYVVDEKTTGSTISPHYFTQFSPDSQMSLYTFAGKAVFGAPIKGVIIDAAQIAVGFSRFERGITMRTEGQLIEWYDTAMYHIEQAQAATRRGTDLPMNPSACGNYGGCPFRAVCARDAGVRQNYLKGDFEQGGGYDPLEIR